MTMQRTHNRRRRYLLSRNIRRNPWTNRGWTLAKFRGCIEETISVIISRTVACGPTPSRIEIGSIAHIHRYLWELRQHRKKLFPQESEHKLSGHRRLTSIPEAESFLKRGAIVQSTFTKIDINTDGTVVCYYPESMLSQELEMTDVAFTKFGEEVCRKLLDGVKVCSDLPYQGAFPIEAFPSQELADGTEQSEEE